MIKEIIDAHFKDTKRPPIEHKDRLYPTSASTFINHSKYKKLEGKCLRASYYSCKGIPEDIELSTDRNLAMKIGEYTENMVLDILKRQGRLIDDGVKFELPKYHVYGKLDAIVTDENGKHCGLEIKSVGSNRYTVGKVWGSQYNPNPYPKWQNLFQTLMYCYAFRGKLDSFILLYIRRDTCEIKEFNISITVVDGKMYPVIDGRVDTRFSINEMLERYQILTAHLEKDIPPQREYVDIYPRADVPKYEKVGLLSKRQVENYIKEPFGDMECKWCGYKKICSGDNK